MIQPKHITSVTFLHSPIIGPYCVWEFSWNPIDPALYTLIDADIKPDYYIRNDVLAFMLNYNMMLDYYVGKNWIHHFFAKAREEKIKLAFDLKFS